MNAMSFQGGSRGQWTSNKRVRKIDLRYESVPFCRCNLRTPIRRVEDVNKPSYGRLYLKCDKCGYLGGWFEPISATWLPTGKPLDLVGEDNSTGDSVAVESDGAVCASSRKTDDRTINFTVGQGNVHYSWIICAILCTLLICNWMAKH